ncbi:hypothetical protein N7509_006712 [Penicillium cosmopolitanum]|uniref:Probable E3 ubiquitin ligase complex SCF subunit sconB n=1 Tax=Penicillium cosmopolitanum TaxID=1131564 RepID=A0A9X0B7Q2_9EURO|nr:uncharacterized protein N7509_006712 [Penicillium cosmopolitanum]KAJ5391222.1 hypothetical protein N7509_006712 [Penicillium cosmopolitanum]
MSSSSDAPRPLRPFDSDLNLSLDSTASSTSTLTSPHAARRPESRLISPRPRDMDEHEKDDIGQAPSNSALGQFSFAPTTRTTVVTTTTTTTTAFPPLIFRPPRATKDLDTRQYPLAASPTPAALRNLRFKIGDQSIVFNEPEDTNATATELREKNEALQTSNGLIRSINSFSSEDNGVPRRLAPPRSVTRLRQPNSQNRPVSPVSIPDPRPAILPRTRAPRNLSEPVARRTRHSAATHLSPAGLATPDAEHNPGSLEEGPAPRQRMHSVTIPRKETLLKSPLSADAGPSSTLQRPSLTSVPSTQADTSGNHVPEPSPFEQHSFGGSSGDTSQRRSEPPSQLSAIDSAMAQDMCLPSPSLSPVTAMNALHGESSFDSEDTDSSLDHNIPRQTKAMRLSGNDSYSNDPSMFSSRSPSSLMDMPKVLEFFDTVPEELKTYMMYQFLRRCPKPTLHFVADVVNPTLKCDFLALLPLELSLNIVKYFDVQTMCRAAQVSKRWRHIINSDEKTWKELLDQDGFVLSEGELERAIREGWGWQCSSPDDFERDLSLPTSSKGEQEMSPVASSSTAVDRAPLSSLALNRRPKRKANTRASSRKLSKRKISSSGTDHSEPDWKREIASSEAPYAAANAAAAAIPYPEVGLPALRGLYLYKALYRRHHAIRRGWMKPAVKPQHIAFRAHDRHVVTCLQFDTDKILTGSDDTNINVYDTKTGALKATLEGHEGGVWALEYHGNTLVSGSTDRSVRVWDIEHARCTQVFHGHTSTVRCLQIVLPTEIGKDANGEPEIMPKTPLIITGSRDSNLRVWKLPKQGDPSYYPSGPVLDDTDCPYFLRVLSGHTHSVRAIAAHGDTLVSGSYDCTVRVWKISTGQVLYTLQGHSMKVYSVVLDPKRNRCISGAMDHMVKVWSLDDGSLLYNLEGHTSLVGLLALQNDHLVSAAADSTLRIWDPEHGHCKSMLSAHTGAITCFQHDGQKVISGSDRTLKMWDVGTGACVRDLLTDLSGVWQVKFNDRRCVAAVQRDSLTYIEVLDFGASRDGVPEDKLGKRVAVNRRGREIAPTSIDSDSESD